MSDDAKLSKRYKRVDAREHVLLRPGMYIGSTDPDRVKTWVKPRESGSDEAFSKLEIEYVPGLYKIFDEIIVNAVDQVARLKADPKATHQVHAIKVTIDASSGIISVENDGDGIPVAVHPETGVYIPEMIFGQLMTSSNYDDDQQRVIGGQTGIGAKACNIFSKVFTVETVDADSGKKYKQRFSDNMSIREAPKITAFSGKPYTRITFLPDYARFHCAGISSDMESLFRRRCYDVCALTDASVSVWLDGKKLLVKSFEKYVDLYVGAGRGRADERV